MFRKKGSHLEFVGPSHASCNCGQPHQNLRGPNSSGKFLSAAVPLLSEEFSAECFGGHSIIQFPFGLGVLLFLRHRVLAEEESRLACSKSWWAQGFAETPESYVVGLRGVAQQVCSFAARLRSIVPICFLGIFLTRYLRPLNFVGERLEGQVTRWALCAYAENH